MTEENTRYLQAYECFQQRDLDKAATICEALLSDHPDHTSALELLAVVRIFQGRQNSAIELLHRTISLQPDEPGPYGRLAVALLGTGRVDEIVDASRRNLGLPPSERILLADYRCALGNSSRKAQEMPENTDIHILYRISDKGHEKNKFADREACFINFLDVFCDDCSTLVVICDNCTPQTIKMVEDSLAHHAGKIAQVAIRETNLGNMGAFKLARDLALEYNDDEIAYLVEDDYLHSPRSPKVIREGLSLADYVSLYDHPEKYGKNGHFVSGGGEVSRVVVTASAHWKYTTHTTLTFAGRV